MMDNRILRSLRRPQLAQEELLPRAELEASGLFDRAWYLEVNPDVARAGLDPLLHYLRAGRFAGRRPNPYFDGSAYLTLYPDVPSLRRSQVIRDLLVLALVILFVWIGVSMSVRRAADAWRRAPLSVLSTRAMPLLRRQVLIVGLALTLGCGASRPRLPPAGPAPWSSRLRRPCSPPTSTISGIST